MADFLPPAVAFLLGNISGFVASMDEADARMAKTEEKQASAGAKGKAAFLGLGVAVAAVAYESVKLASVFDATMTRINTQDNAGLTTQQMKALKASVLDLAGPTAQAPEVLAEAMIHVYGSGLKGAAALDLLKVAAEGATTGHANLVDVTNALDAAVAVGIKGTGDYNVAMGELNATVGAGDMTMQNLAEALGGPMLATVKGYGLSITDVGAALAVFGDRNIRGAEAATELRMATQALAVPAASGARALASIGLNVNTLRDDLQQGGLKQALNDLNQHLLAAGYNSTTAGALITQAFGKKAGGGLNVLLDSLASSTSNFNEKFQAVSESGKTFAADFAQTQDTLAFKMHALGAETQAVGIRIGEYLIPKITDLASLVGRDVGPVLKQFGTDLRTAMDSPAAHQAEAVLKGVFTDLGRFLADASSAARGFGLALEPAAAILTEVFLVGLAATGKILADVVGPALKATAGFFRDNSDVIKVLSEVALAGLAAKLLYVGAIAGIDMFATFATGIGTAITGIAAFVRAVASGAVFDTIRLKAMYAADAVRGVGAASTAAAAEADGAAAGGFGRVAGALGRSLPIIGGVVLAAGYLGQKLNDLATSGDDASMSVDQLTVALMKSGNQANSAGNSMGGLGNTMSLFGTKISGVTDPMAAMGIALGKIDQMMSGSTGDGLKNYDAALAQLVQSGNGDRAAQVIAQVAAATDDHGNKIINTVRDFPAYFAALDAVKAHAALAAGATDKAASSLDKLPAPLKAAMDAALGTAGAITQVDDAFTELSGNLSTSKALDTFRKDLLSVKDTLAKNGSSLDINTKQGLDNRDAFRAGAQEILAYRDAQLKSHVPVEYANLLAGQQADQLLKVWKQAGANTVQIDAYSKELGLIPTDLTTSFTLKITGLGEALAGVAQLDAAVKNAGSAGITHPKGGVGVKFQAAGGWVRGPGGPTSDSVPTMLSNREFVVSAGGAASFPAALLEAVNSGNVGAARAALGAGASGPRTTSGQAGAPGGDVAVNVYVQTPGQPGWQLATTTRTEVLRYNQRNSKANLALTGIGN